MTSLVINFEEDGADQLSLVGGKGANLGKLTQAGLPVPPGFNVTTASYLLFIEENQLDQRINDILSRVKYQDADDVEALTAEIRQAIVAAAMPEPVAGAIQAAYAKLGSEPYVAVRSSGTAEDLAEASFAGLHDTYLDIRGLEPVLDAVKRCWASLWTARATAYRSNKGFNHLDAQLAVVIQIMVEAEVAGVMFTGNPMTAATNEIIVNSSWGLGEAVVSGIVTPDEFTLNGTTLAVKARTLGTKGLRIFRDAASDYGTVTEDVSDLDQKRFTLTDKQLAELGRVGQQVTTYYNEIPQDIEWAFRKDGFYLLQSRPITGVEFAWNEALESYQLGPDDDDITWSRSWADEVWTGAITPLMYTWRGSLYTLGHINCMKLWGMGELASQRRWQYYKGTAYHNCGIEQELVKTAWSPFRSGLMTHVAPDKRADVLKAPFNLIEYLRIHARIGGLEPSASINKWIKYQYDEYIYNPERWKQADGLPNEVLRDLSDADLKNYINGIMDLERDYFQDMWSGFFLHARDSMSLLGWMVAQWYDGDNTMVFSDLITGVPKRTSTMEENLQLWRLSTEIRNSPELLALFEANPGATFFEKLSDSDMGKAFAEKYAAFMAEYGHRGQADRDVYYPRRIEDASIDYNAFSAFLSSSVAVDPEAKEHEINTRRDAVIEDVIQNLRKKPFGFLKVEAFKVVLDYVHQFFMYRDNERHMTDRITWGGKRGLLELNRRLIARNQVASERDFYFLGLEELYDLFDGRANAVLTQSKIRGRMHDFDRFLSKDVQLPMYMKANRAISFESESQDAGSGHLRGTGTSRGTIKGVARIVKSLKDIGRIKEGEILVTNSTDPGWTPVFMVISGIVLETGGMLAHGSCLAREYGLPAVQIENAMQLIPDGAVITINGDSGALRIELDEDVVAEQTEEVAA